MDNSWRKIIVKENGSVLLIVMMIITVVLAVALSRNEKLLTYYNQLTALQDNQQGYIYCVSALKGVIILLKHDSKGYNYSGDQWAMLPILPIENGKIQITVIPLESKISLIGLSSSNNAVSERTKRAIDNLIPDFNNISQMNTAIIGDFYSIEALQYGGFKDIKRKGINSLTVEDTGGKININFAEKDVLQAYLPELDADEIISYRDKKPFKEISQIRNVPGISDSGYLAIQPYITVNSVVFYVYVEAVIKDKKTSVSAILKKGKTGNIEINKYFEKVNERYMNNMEK